MPNDYFHFKQFSIRHDRCAMPVGTDGVLLGAWAGAEWTESYPHILDIGTGSGLIALMLAQRLPRAQVVAVEIDHDSACQARQNVAQSPFAQRIKVLETDFLTYADESIQPHADCEPAAANRTEVFTASVGFDLVVSNPPFFTETLSCPNPQRHQARHVTTLTWDTLLAHSIQLLRPAGRIALIVPAAAEIDILSHALRLGLTLRRRTRVCTTPRKPPRRVLLEWEGAGQPTVSPSLHDDTLCLQDSDGMPTAAYRALTHDFYLKF